MAIINNHVNGLLKEMQNAANYLRKKGFSNRAYALERKISSFNKYGRKYLPSEATKHNGKTDDEKM